MQGTARPLMEEAGVSAGRFVVPRNSASLTPSFAGDRLRRNSRNVAPTESGERVLETLGPALASIHGALDDLGRARGRMPGAVRITATRLAYVMEDRAAAFLTQGRLARLMEEWTPPFPGFFLYCPSRAQMLPVLDAFIAVLRQRRATPASS